MHGIFARWRVAFVILTQVVFYGLPWLTWNDRQAVLFDLGARKFHIFGLVFWPQDLIFLTGLLVISALSLFLFTAVAGRLWCGYACPQTVYTEMFMWIERKIEGDRTRRMQLDQARWGTRKFALKAFKHAVWLAIALWTGFTFVGYFTPITTLIDEVATGSLSPWQTFWILFYAGATYGNAGYLREQVCKYMCPYARFQSVMFDSDTLIVTYDPLRGEPRGPRSRKVDHRAAGLGDCVDCTICVQVCPVGIDIRKGLQYECIGCAACIDGCDQVMDKMGYPRGLIRYSTENALLGKTSEKTTGFGKVTARLLRPRVVIYAAILVGADGSVRCQPIRARAAEGQCVARSRNPGQRRRWRAHRERLPAADRQRRRAAAPLCDFGDRSTRSRSRARRSLAGRNRCGLDAHVAGAATRRCTGPVGRIARGCVPRRRERRPADRSS